MSEATQDAASVKKRAAGLYTIIVIKVGKGLLLFALALGIYSLLGEDLRAEFERFLRWMSLDPEHKFFSDLGDKIQTITPSNIRWVASGTMLYGLLLLVEGIGLIFRVFWAGWRRWCAGRRWSCSAFSSSISPSFGIWCETVSASSTIITRGIDDHFPA
jgi:uncharacterized membrane protein (DUF2068 family)